MMAACEKCQDRGHYCDDPGTGASVYCECLLGEALTAIEDIDANYGVGSEGDHRQRVETAQEKVSLLASGNQPVKK